MDIYVVCLYLEVVRQLKTLCCRNFKTIQNHGFKSAGGQGVPFPMNDLGVQKLALNV